jgi:hypothetical protein
LVPELKGRELNAPQLQAPPGAFHRNTPSRARLGARLDGSVGLKLAVSQLNRSQGLRKWFCVPCVYIIRDKFLDGRDNGRLGLFLQDLFCVTRKTSIVVERAIHGEMVGR